MSSTLAKAHNTPADAEKDAETEKKDAEPRFHIAKAPTNGKWRRRSSQVKPIERK